MHWSLLDGVLIAVFALAVFDGARRGLSPYLAEFGAFVLSLAVAFAVFAPIVLVLSRFAGVPATAAAVGVFLFILVAAHGLAWPALRHWTGLAEKRLGTAGIRLGAVPALATALAGTAVVLSALVVLPGQSGLRATVQGSLIGGRLLRASSFLPFRSVLGGPASPAPSLLGGQHGDTDTTFYHLNLPAGLTPEVDQAAEKRMLGLVNEARRQNGLQPLVMDAQLQAAARAHSLDMYKRRYFSHITPDGKTPFQRLRAMHISFLAAGENIALAPSVDPAEESLMTSPEHRANILSPDYLRVGIGVLSAAGYEEMFTQEFADSG